MHFRHKRWISRGFVKVNTETGCWEWQKGLLDDGYGRANYKGNDKYRAHRLSYELANKGVDISDLVIRHKCDNPICVNPDHLETGTQAENVMDMLTRDRSAHTKLTVEQVKEIRSSKKSSTELANEYGVSKLTITRILTNLTYTWVK